MKRWRGTVGVIAIVGWVAVTTTACLAAQTPGDDSLPPLDGLTYRQALDEIVVALKAEDMPGARVLADTLRGRHFEVDGYLLPVDGSLLAAVDAAQDAASMRAVLARLHVAQEELAGSYPEASGDVDTELLQQILEEQVVEALLAQGELTEVEVPSTVFHNRFTIWLGDVFVWFGGKLEGVLEWLLEHWRSESERERSSARLDARLVTFFVVLLVGLIAWLAWRWLRTDQGSVESSLVDSGQVSRQASGDDNPLSREGDEWQRYAEQLAAAGRLREAIRAWYHAVLVHLYRSGLLHYRKGRTNWEYIAALSPRLGWRSRFIDLTRRFENEWYGHGASGEEALQACRRAAMEILAHVQGEPGS